MEKRLIVILLALALLLGVTGCGEKDRARPALDLPPEPSSLEVQSPEPDSPAEEPGEEEWPQADDAMVREIIKMYGAEERMLPGDKEPSLVVKDAGLFQYRSNWDSVRELSPLNYFCWFLTTTYDEDPEYKKEHYTHPLGEDYGLFVPRDLFEERVQRYFRASARHLRSQGDYPCYDPELDGYTFGLAVGIGETATIEYSYTQESGWLTIDITMKAENRPEEFGRLSAVMQRDGGWHYIGWDYRPDPMPENGKTREEVDFLTREQLDLLDKAWTYCNYFSISGGSFYGDSGWQDSAPEVEIDGIEYLKYTGSLYGGWEDFYRDMCSVFTPEYFERLNDVDFGLWGEEKAGPLYREMDGDLYCSIRDGGANLSYLPERDRYVKMFADEERIVFSCYSYYCEREDVGKEDPTPTSMKERRFRLVNTPEGWRVDLYSRP